MVMSGYYRLPKCYAHIAPVAKALPNHFVLCFHKCVGIVLRVGSLIRTGHLSVDGMRY